MLRTVKQLLVSTMSRFELTRGLLVRYYDRFPDGIRGGGKKSKRHPIDEFYGIRTDGVIPKHALLGNASNAEFTAYIGSQPSTIRHALSLVPEPEKTTLLDLGCGKGRVLAVASEFPFREVVGVEISAAVAAIAEDNMAIVRRKFPDRCPIRVVAGDALKYPLPDGPIAIFLYRPFGETGTAQLVAHIEASLKENPRPLTIIYTNPVYGAVFDKSTALVRAHALSLPYDEGEVSSGAGLSDNVVIWQDREHSAGEPPPEAQRSILRLSDELTELAPVEAR